MSTNLDGFKQETGGKHPDSSELFERLVPVGLLQLPVSSERLEKLEAELHGLVPQQELGNQQTKLEPSPIISNGAVSGFAAIRRKLC